MPKGIEPQFNEDGTVNTDDIKAKIMSGGTSYAPVYEDIPADLISVQVLQKPGDAAGYKTPNIMQDPVLSSETMNKTGHSYVDEDPYYSADDGASWVLRITVNQSLSKWFNRSTSYGYMMYVDIPSHVYETPESEYWYDEVMVKPIDTTHQDSLYYQIYDTTSLFYVISINRAIFIELRLNSLWHYISKFQTAGQIPVTVVISTYTGCKILIIFNCRNIIIIVKTNRCI